MADHDMLWQSFANAERAGMEADALMAALGELLADGGLGSLRIDMESAAEENHETEQGWAVAYCLYSYKIIPARGRSINRGWAYFGVSFWRAEDERGAGWCGANAAKLYVGYWPPKGEGWSTDTLVVDGAGQSLDTQPFTARRWRGVGAAGSSEAWFFCLRLTALQSRSDLEREVATPLRLLLEGRPEELAFAESVALLAPPAIAP